MRSVPVLVLLITSPAAGAQRADQTRPPVTASGDDGFRVRQLPGPLTIDGHEWTEVNVVSGPVATTAQAPDRTFVLSFQPAGADTGDFERYQLYLQRGRTSPVRIDEGLTGWAYITPDSRFVFSEPLYVLDVRQWKRYRLFDTFGIENYISIAAVSSDGRRLYMSRVDCAIDCPDEPRQYYELTLPGR